MEQKNCQNCGNIYSRKHRNMKWFLSSKYCSNKCSRIVNPMKGNTFAKGMIHTDKYKEMMSLIHKGNTHGFKKGQPAWNKGMKGLWLSDKFLELNGIQKGEKHPRWKVDRTKIKIGDRFLNDTLQKGWRKAVKDRDNWKCRIADSNCFGRLEAHHILPWLEFPELRYQINNGITLCHAHHPRKRSEVAELSPYFQSLVAEMN